MSLRREPSQHGTTSDQAYRTITRQLPQPNRFAFVRGGKIRRFRDRYLLMRLPRPIQSYLVTHRRRFTTGHKHKQPYQG